MSGKSTGTPRRTFGWLPLAGAVVIVLAGLFPAPLAAKECTECHDANPWTKKTSVKSIHEPFKEKDCTSCHGEHDETNQLLLTAEGKELCTPCHEIDDDAFRKSHRQLPVENISCLSCHHPHASVRTKLIRPGIHRPLANGLCGDCHREDGKLRTKKINLLCFRCHDGKIFTGISKHDPVSSGDCDSCHDPHGSPNVMLLTSRYPLERYLPFRESAYGLCFECHEAEGFTLPGVEAETGFKDGKQNLHWLHVVKAGVSSTGGVTREGTTCRNCHLPHASSRQKLVRENLDCGGGVLCLKLGYIVKDGTVTCTGGCHKPASYPSGKEVAPPADAASGAVTAPASPSYCLECHKESWERFQGKKMHQPVKNQQCTACHLDHGADNKLLLVAYEGRLCSRCHDLKAARFGEAHQGYEVGGSHCLRCHDPHSSGGAKLLYETSHEPFGDASCGDCHQSGTSWVLDRPVNEICADCHGEMLEKSILHTAVGKNGCTGCHSPHVSATAGLLLDPQPKLCFRCHEQRGFVKPFRHSPVEEGDCAACHDPHGGPIPSLLTKDYPPDRYLPFDAGKYALCFECHGEEVFTDPANSETAFREGKTNLHLLHVNPNGMPSAAGENRRIAPGTTCRNCHEPHSTDQPVLVRQSLDCGGVPCLNLEFKKIGISGRCARGCHTPKVYQPAQE